jgi:hypothetical protein
MNDATCPVDPERHKAHLQLSLPTLLALPFLTLDIPASPSPLLDLISLASPSSCPVPAVLLFLRRPQYLIRRASTHVPTLEDKSTATASIRRAEASGTIAAAVRTSPRRSATPL